MVNCPTCGQPLPADDVLAQRGVLINRIATTSAHVVDLNLRLKLPFRNVADREWSEQRLDESIKALEVLKQELLALL